MMVEGCDYDFGVLMVDEVVVGCKVVFVLVKVIDLFYIFYMFGMIG